MFWEVAQTSDDSSHGNQAASNAILAAIAANDALCMHLAGLQPKGESHVEAARVLQAACRGTRWEAEAPGPRPGMRCLPLHPRHWCLRAGRAGNLAPPGRGRRWRGPVPAGGGLWPLVLSNICLTCSSSPAMIRRKARQDHVKGGREDEPDST
jgi:hypothetical protein